MDNRPQAPFGTVLTAVLTPFDENGAVDYGVFWKLIRHLADNGNDGVVVAGTTGESPTLSKPEKIALFKAAVEAAGDRMKVVAGTGTYNTAESITLTEQAASVGVDAVMAVTPYYSKPPQAGLAKHFTAIAEASDLPLMLYNIPGRTSRLIEVETLVELAHHDKIVAVKDAVGDLDYTTRAIKELPEGFAVYSGDDARTKDIVYAGGVGVVSVAGHFVGSQIQKLIAAVIEENHDEANRIQEALLPIFGALFVEPSPMPLKAGMTALWNNVGEPRLPLIPAADETTEKVKAAYEVAQGV
ncbi:MAG: 4-hydroxy-tetrahydrodipicolinate synthase [Acidimicrobiia bacterium]|nr:4-hydroxy-tetrahydrodipicolinate synthase [Acidimicrobiia bacterium]MDX2465670.1 4-hydroxy-tetrahydrodipicolinate synthase [Acidimicrobiia bacterium]